jgi:putative transposase
MQYARRRALPHEVPLWVKPPEEVYFITVCCEERGLNQLAREGIAKEIFESVRFRNEQNIWFVSLMVLMPDHLHALVSFPPHKQTIIDRVGNWKRWTATQFKISWQSGFFEHRIRSKEEREAKSAYVLLNPVRAGLVNDPNEWPYVWRAAR